MNTVRFEKDSIFRNSVKSNEFHIFMNDILPKARKYVLQKLEYRNRIIVWSISGVLALPVAIYGLLEYNQNFEDVSGLLSFGGGLLFVVSVFKLYIFYKRYKKVAFNPSINSIATFPVNIATYTTEAGIAVVDEDEFLEKTSMQFENIKDFSETEKLLQDYNSIINFLPSIQTQNSPTSFVIENDQGINTAFVCSEETALQKVYTNLDHEYKNLDIHQFELSIIQSDNPLIDYIRKHVFKVDRAILNTRIETQRLLNSFMGVIQKKESNTTDVDVDKWSEELRGRIASDSIKLMSTRHQALIKVVGNLYPRLGDIVNYSSYLFYCPYCHVEQLQQLISQDFNIFNQESISPVEWDENARAYLVDWRTETWKCCSCERETNSPIPIHKLYKQVMFPAYESLLFEHEGERIRVYSELKNKKIEYKQEAEKETEQIMRETRREVDEQIFKLRAIDSQVRSTKRTVNAMQDLMVRMESVSKEKIAAIDSYAESIQNQIVKENRQVEIDIHAEVQENLNQTNRAIGRLAFQAEIAREKQMAIQKEIANNIRRTADNTSKMVQQNEQIIKNTGVSAACDLAQARRSGADKHPWWRVGANIKRQSRILGDKFTGRSELDSAQRALRR